MFNSKEDLEEDIKFGMEIKTPHYIIEFTHDGDYWHAEITDLHKSKFVVAVSLHKEEIKTVKQALDDISDTIVEYEFENKFAGEGRVLIRPSGTEPLVRVMIEGKNQQEIDDEAKKLAKLITRVML